MCILGWRHPGLSPRYRGTTLPPGGAHGDHHQSLRNQVWNAYLRYRNTSMAYRFTSKSVFIGISISVRVLREKLFLMIWG